MPSEEKLQQQADNKRAHALARVEAYTPVDPATVDISDRIFTSEEEEPEGQTARVLQLPAEPKTADEAKTQERVAFLK